MRVTFTSFFRNGLEDIGRAGEELARRQREVSSLKRVQVPSDDPSATGGIIGEYAEMRAADQYIEATDSVDSRLKVADSALTDIIKNLTSALTTVAASRQSFLSGEQRDAYALQLQGTRDAILSDVNLEFRGTFIFAGTTAGVTPFEKSGAGTVGAYQGNADTMAVDIDRSRAVDVTFDGGRIVGDLFDVFEALESAIGNGDPEAMDAGFQGLQAAFDRVTNAQSRVGNAMAALEEHKIRLREIRNASDARRSALQDANLAEAITRMQQADTAHRAALGAVSSASRLSLLDYLE